MIPNLCEEGYLFPNVWGTNWWCGTPYLPETEVNTMYGCPALLVSWCCEPCTVGLGGEPIWGVGQGYKIRPHAIGGQLVLANVPIEGWFMNPYEHGLQVVLVVVCDSLPTMENVSSLVWWSEVLAWLYMGEGALRYSLNLSPKVCTHHTPAYHTCICILLHFCGWCYPCLWVPLWGFR